MITFIKDLWRCLFIYRGNWRRMKYLDSLTFQVIVDVAIAENAEAIAHNIMVNNAFYQDMNRK